MKKSWCIIFQRLFMQFLRFRMYGTERFRSARYGFTLALIAGLLLLLPASGLAAKHALLIGIADYRVSGITSLDGPVNDIDIVKKILKDRFQFHNSEITVLLDPDATHTITINYSAETDDTVMRVLGPFLSVLIFGGCAFALLWGAWSGIGKKKGFGR